MRLNLLTDPIEIAFNALSIWLTHCAGKQKRWPARRLSLNGRPPDSSRWTLSAVLVFYDEVQRFETHPIKMALAETGGNQAKAARLWDKSNHAELKIKLLNIEIG